MAGLQDTRVDMLYTLEETIARDIFEGVTYPWEVLPKIGAFIIALGNTLPEEVYEKKGENIWKMRGRYHRQSRTDRACGDFSEGEDKRKCQRD